MHAQVYKAQWRVQTVAVKMLSNTTAKQMEGFKREALILEDLKDTNIVQFMGACFEDSGDSMLVTEFMAGGNLFDAIGNDRDGKLGWYQRCVKSGPQPSQVLGSWLCEHQMGCPSLGAGSNTDSLQCA